jgi:hypothetical protein
LFEAGGRLLVGAEEDAGQLVGVDIAEVEMVAGGKMETPGVIRRVGTTLRVKTGVIYFTQGGMLFKAALACFGLAMPLAGLGLAAAQLHEDQGTQSANLELLTTIFVVGCFVAIAAALLFLLAFVGLWAYRYFHTVRVLPGQWHPRYWPLQRVAQVGGIWIKREDWAGDIKLTCQVQFGSDETTFTRTVKGLTSGTYGIEFPQQPVDFLGDPKEGDTAIIMVKASPPWWRGRPAHLTQQASIGVTDHRMLG